MYDRFIIRVFSFVFVLLLAAAATAQQQNDAIAALSVNGTGMYGVAAGGVVPTSSALVPPLPGGAPLYWHRIQAGAALEIRVQGTPGNFVIVALGTPVAPINVGASGFIEINPATAMILVDGLNPAANLYNATARIGPNGSWTLLFGGGLPPGMPVLHLQAAVVDFSVPSVRLSASVSIETRNDIETLNRNFVDAVNVVASNPLYGMSLATPGFKWDGLSILGFLSDVVDLDGRLRFQSVFPNRTSDPALPAGPPTTTGQQVVHGLEVVDEGFLACPGLPTQERIRLYELRAGELGGVWKTLGNQIDAEIYVDIECVVTSSNPVPGTPDAVYIVVEIEERVDRGGIDAVTISGPQMAGLNVGVHPHLATAATPGIVTLSGFGDSEFFRMIQVGSPTTSSRFPENETSIAPRDIYDIWIHWGDGSTSGPYAVPIRSTIDVAGNPAAAAAAIPGLGTPAGVLSNPGLATASLMLSFAVGAMPSPSDWSAVTLDFFQATPSDDLEFEFENLSPVSSPVQLCVPGLLGGTTTFVEFSRVDAQGAKYIRTLATSF